MLNFLACAAYTKEPGEWKKHQKYFSQKFGYRVIFVEHEKIIPAWKKLALQKKKKIHALNVQSNLYLN